MDRHRCGIYDPDKTSRVADNFCIPFDNLYRIAVLHLHVGVQSRTINVITSVNLEIANVNVLYILRANSVSSDVFHNSFDLLNVFLKQR
jgi:hypothetical protein